MHALQNALPRTYDVLEHGREEGLHLGGQIYVSRDGEVVADDAFGGASEGVPMTSDVLMLWLSSAKPVAAVAVAQLWERGRLELDDRVARHIPEFGVRGKEAITIRHVLTHTGGFRQAEKLWRIAPWEEIIDRINEAPLEPSWIPGERAGYHVASGWFILGELIRRLDGRPFGEYVREEIFEPLGMRDSWIGMPVERYHSYRDRIGEMYDTSGSEPKAQSFYSSEGITTLSRPGGNGRGPIRELGIFYEMLLFHGQREGVQILRPQTVEAMTARHRVGMKDETFGHVMDWGLGFIINSAMYGEETVPYGYGPNASRRTFGHSGHQSSTGFADPERRLVVAWAFNGMPGEAKHDRRLRAMDAAIYEDLGLMGL
jgi:CubicO group peptidase (beta-lactamase class C family)